MTRGSIDRFVSGKSMAIVGVSSGGKGFGNLAYTELKKQGYTLLPVHPTAESIQGDRCSRSLADLPERVERVLVVVKPDRSEAVVREAASAGARQVWLQQGAESAAALEAGERAGLEVIHGHCILMFAGRPGSLHRVHRWILTLVGKMPK